MRLNKILLPSGTMLGACCYARLQHSVLDGSGRGNGQFDWPSFGDYVQQDQGYVAVAIARPGDVIL